MAPRIAPAALVVSALVACQPSPLALGASCARGSECASGTCAFGRCRAGCAANRDCPGGASCLLDTSGLGACGVAIDLGCELGIGRACPTGLVCVADRCERACASAVDCPSDGECRPVSSGGASFCFDPRTAPDAGPPDDAATPDAGADAPAVDAGPTCAIADVCFERSGAACARDCMGRVWCWGAEHGGGLGNGGNQDVTRDVPGLVVDAGGSTLADVDSLACGDGFACVHVAPTAARHAGSVMCWGFDVAAAWTTSLALGATDLLSPIVLPSASVAASWHHACVLDRDTGEVRCFGRNDAMIDPASPADRLYATPTAPAGITGGVADIGVAAYGACALGRDGQVRCWGQNDHGQAGHAPIEAVAGAYDPDVAVTTIEISAGVPLDDVVQLAVGMTQRAVLTTPSGVGTPTLLTWGGNEHCQCGDVAGTPGEPCEDQLALGSACRTAPRAPASAPAFESIASEGSVSTSCGVLAANHHVLCWGVNFGGIAGVPGGGVSWLALDAEVEREDTGAALDDVTRVFVGNANACAVRGDGSLWCWGPNQDAQLARPADAVERRAVPITFPFP